ncbi:MAG: polysulfide reductase NrfD [Acidobacteria bacterium]|nr:polysulfide reductase NrfD [Acidobacteriota bacterium]
MSQPAIPIEEERLVEIRREAERLGQVQGGGVRPAGAPFPQASPETGYYGLPLLKEPQWNWAIPLYFFVGGAAGSSGVIATMAEWAGGNRELARQARLLALGGAGLSGALLVYDLGRPARFLNMLRVFKPQSPMSMGAWILTAFSTSTAAAVFADLVSKHWNGLPVRLLGGSSKLFSTLFGMPFSNYTGVLIGATAIAAWNREIDMLPLHFGMSGLQAAASLLELLGNDDSRALNLLGMLASALETFEGIRLESKPERALAPLKHGPSGWVTRAGGLLSGPVPLLLRAAALAGGNRQMRRWAAWSGIAGSLLTRYGWMRAGHASARDFRLPLEI